MKKNVRLLFATNDWRSKQLTFELQKKVSQLTVIEYDPVPALYKYLAALLTYSPDRMVWWNKFQWHPLIQRGRRARLLGEIKRQKIEFDVLVMWGSWMDPLLGSQFSDKPFFFYIDQSCDKTVDEGDPVAPSKGLFKAQIAFNRDQLRSYERAGAVFCMSQWAVEQTLRAHDIEPSKVRKVGWGAIGLDLLEENMSSTEKVPTVLFVGNEFHRKGVDFIREAITDVVSHIGNVQFNIVGSNVDGLKVLPHPNLNILGAVRDAEKMKALYRQAWVIVQPHRFDRSPHVLIEAMSAGKPIVTSHQGGAKEVVLNGHNGFSVEVGDVAALAENIVRLLQDEELRQKLGENSKRLVGAEYTWERIAQKIVDQI